MRSHKKKRQAIAELVRCGLGIFCSNLVNTKTIDILNIADKFNQDLEDVESCLLADILIALAEKDYSELLALRDQMARDAKKEKWFDAKFLSLSEAIQFRID